jgi:hypothetical protein
MLFIAMAKPRHNVTEHQKPRMQRRHAAQIPGGIKIHAEYWPVGNEYAVVIIFEADSVDPIFHAVAEWDDVFETVVTPVVTSEQGLTFAARLK